MKKSAHKFVIVAQGTGKEMTYDGEKFSERTPKHFTSVASAVKFGNKLVSKFRVLKKYRISVRTVSISTGRKSPVAKSHGSALESHVSGLSSASRARRTKRKSNPAIRDAELQQAAALLEEFSGHKPTEVLRVSEKPMRKGLVIGQLDGVLYTTVRDGKVEAYVHKFRKKSRPLLTASADGTQLGIVGGRFQMTEAGIEDR